MISHSQALELDSLIGETLEDLRRLTSRIGAEPIGVSDATARLTEALALVALLVSDLDPDSLTEWHSENEGPAPFGAVEHVRECLDLGLQVWRTTPVRAKFLRAFEALTAIENTTREVREMYDARRDSLLASVEALKDAIPYVYNVAHDASNSPWRIETASEILAKMREAIGETP